MDTVSPLFAARLLHETKLQLIECPEIVRRGLPEAGKRLHCVALNLARRHLTDAQKVILGREIEPDVAERARER